MRTIRKVRLSEIAELITKGTTPTTLGYDFQDNGVNFLKIECFSENGDFIKEKVAHISEKCHERLKRSQLRAGDVLFSIAGAIGRVAIVTKKMLPANTNQALAIIRIARDDIYLPYVKLILKSPIVKTQFERKKQGVAQLNISLKDITELEIPLPDMDQQIECAELFKKISEIIDFRQQELQKLDELVNSRFIELFGTLSINEQNFKVLTIESLCSLIKDGTHQTPTYTEDTINGFKFLSSKDVMSKRIDWSDIKYIPSDLHEKLYAVVKPIRNDILMSKNGVNYGVAAVNDTDEVFDIYVSLALLRPKTDIINPVYFCSAINSPDTKRQFDGSIKGIGVPNLHLGEIKKTKILVPPLDKQIEYVSFVEQVDKSKFAVQQTLDKAQELFDSLMQKYFGWHKMA